MAKYTDIIIVPIIAVFLVLKLCGIEPVGSWPWWVVTAPIWGGIILNLGLSMVGRMWARKNSEVG